MSGCLILKTEYKELEKLQQEFELELEKSIKSGNLEKTKELKQEIEEKLQTLKEKITPKKIIAKFSNPETTKTENKDKDIEIDLEKEIQWQKAFYKEHKLSFNEQEVKQILRLHKFEIQKEMAMYGYDQILIIPENLPITENLNQTLIESMPNTTATYQSNDFKTGGGFAGATTESRKTKIILTHSDQNIYENPDANFFAKQTLGKNIMQLSNLIEDEIQEKIRTNQPIPINFETRINNQTKKIQAEGLSLNEYLIFQRQYFEKNNQQKHLDENGWTWLPKSCSASRVVVAHWYPDARRLDVSAYGLGHSDGNLGCRLSRSFELT
ncbi:MAG: hypothetical protein Q7U36_02415 [bacterium]|nr:hypothetical protein [bacterium]